MADMNYASVCGVYCGDCGFLNENCRGCGYEKGKPFWTVMMPSRICPLYDCCRNSKNLEHCGQCDDFPCQSFLELRDPNLTDDEFEKSLARRQDELRRRTEVGTANWLEEKSVP